MTLPYQVINSYMKQVGRQGLFIKLSENQSNSVEDAKIFSCHLIQEAGDYERK